MSEQILAQELATFGISLHQSILSRLVGEIQEAIGDGRIRSHEGKHSVYDFMVEVLEVRASRETWKRFAANDPDCVTFCDSTEFPRKDGRAGHQKSPTMGISGLIYIAYMGGSDYSQRLRRSSAALLAAGAKISPETQAVTQARQDHEAYPISIDELHRTTQIVNKSQIKKAIERDLILGRDYIDLDGKFFLTFDMFCILSLSFRSMAGTDISRLPDILPIKTAEYFRIQESRRINARMGQRAGDSPGQLVMDMLA